MTTYQPVPVIFAQLPTGDFPASYFDQDFSYLLGLLNTLAPGVIVVPEVETGAGPFVIPAGTRAFVLNKLVASATTLVLPSAALQGGFPLVIADWGGNAGDITLTPSGADKIMGALTATLISNGQGLGGGGRTTLYPSTIAGAVGWFGG